MFFIFQITQLKINHNPFAKGFRDSGGVKRDKRSRGFYNDSPSLTGNNNCNSSATSNVLNQGLSSLPTLQNQLSSVSNASVFENNAPNPLQSGQNNQNNPVSSISPIETPSLPGQFSGLLGIDKKRDNDTSEALLSGLMSPKRVKLENDENERKNLVTGCGAYFIFIIFKNFQIQFQEFSKKHKTLIHPISVYY